MQFLAHILIVSEATTASDTQYIANEEIYSIQAEDENLAEMNALHLIGKMKVEFQKNNTDGMSLSVSQAIDYGLTKPDAAFHHYGIHLRKVIAVISYDGSTIDHIHLGNEFELNYGTYLIESKRELDRFIANDFARVIVLE